MKNTLKQRYKIVFNLHNLSLYTIELAISLVLSLLNLKKEQKTLQKSLTIISQNWLKLLNTTNKESNYCKT